MKLLAGIDLGTTTLKGIIINEQGEVLSTRKLPAEYEYPQKDVVEFSSERFYQKFCLLIKELLDKLSDSGQIVAVSLSGATGNTLLLDKNNKPLRKTISWLDKRSLDFSTVLHGINYKEIYQIVGWPFLEIFPLAHLIWLKTKNPKVYRSASRYLLNISYLYYRLTGRFVMDYSTATTFYLQDQEKRIWHKPFLDLLGISGPQLPELLPSGTRICNLNDQSAEETGLPRETQVVLGSFDHPAAARGAGVLQEGSLLLSCGTSWVGLYPIKNRHTGLDNKMLIDPFLSPAGPWAAMFSIPGIGKTIDTLINHLVKKEYLPKKHDLFTQKASQSPPGAHHVTLEILKPAEQLIADLLEVRKTHCINDVFRAIMEVTAFEIKRNMDYYEKKGLKVREITMVGGASESKLWRHILADITGHPIRFLNGQIAGALGSTIMAGIGAGLFRDEKEGFARIGGSPMTINPDPKNTGAYKVFYQKYLKKYHNTKH